DYALCATNTHYQCGPTYHGLRGHNSYIGYIVMPIRYLPRVRRRNIAYRLTKRLRAFPSQRLLDHMMLYIDVDCALTHDKPKMLPQWDFTRIFLASHDERYHLWAKQLRDDIERDLTNLLREYG
ncbi:unnamed protein product, partial [Prorocentrum cordatum]